MSLPRPLVVAVDGPAASGKSTLAAKLADALGLTFLDTGLLYRAVATRLMVAGADPGDAMAAEAAARALHPDELDPVRLADDAVGQAASKVAAHPGVRAVLLPFQRRIASAGAGAVLAGRDVGSTVCPEAPAKLYVTAALETRAQRRLTELLARGEAPIYASVLAEMRERDRRDGERASAPLRVVHDAMVLDTTGLDVPAALAAALALVHAKLGRRDGAPADDQP